MEGIMFIKNNINIIIIVIYILLLCLLKTLNLKKEYRYKQLKCVVTSFVMIILMLGLSIYISRKTSYEIFFETRKISKEILYLCYLIPSFFGIIFMLIEKAGVRISFREPKEKKNLSVNSPYEKIGEDYYLKDHYRFFREIVSWIVVVFFMCSIASVYSIVYKVNFVKFYKNFEGAPYLPLFFSLGYIFVSELYFYLSGNENIHSDIKETEKRKKAIKTEELKSFNELYQDYKKVWSKNLMADLSKENKMEEQSQKILADKSIENKEIEEIYLSLKKDYVITPQHFGILEDLFKNKDTIISDANYEELSPIIFSYLEKSIVKGKKILVLAETDLYTNAQNRQMIKNWFEDCFRKLYKKNIRKIVTFEDWRNHNDWDIVIGTQSEIIKYQQDFIEKIQKEQNELKDLIIFVINEKLDEIAENVLTLSILCNILNTHFKIDKNEDQGAQYIILSNGTANLKVSINKNLGINAEEHHIINNIPKNFYGIIWKTDTLKEYYTEIMDGVPKVELGIANTLSYLAWDHGYNNINFMEQNDLPYSSYEGNMEAAKDYLKERPVRKSNLNNLYRNVVKNNPITSLIHKAEKNILFIEDKICNAPVLLKKYASLGTEETFLNIISDNYLLRDYFVDNIDYFTNSPHYGYTPKIENNSYKVAAYLKELLTNNQIKVSEDDIKIELMSIESNVKNVEEELVNLFLTVYNIDILKRDYLTVDAEQSYNIEKNCFEEKKFYKLSGDVTGNTCFKWFENFEIIDSGRRIYGMIPYEHVYQNYLKGQTHCFDGKSYSIENIDVINKKINIIPSKREKRVIYRNKDKISIEKVFPEVQTNHVTSQNAKYILEKKTQYADYEIETIGYYEFFNGISLRDQNYKYNSLESLREKFIRDYKNGQILSVSLKIKEFKILNSNETATALTVLFNEIFRTMFPGNYKYIKIFTAVPEGFYKVAEGIEYSEEGFITPEYLSHVLPYQVTIPKTEYKSLFEENNEDQINLYFVEDSHKDIGLIRAISDNFEEILELVQDYLNWVKDGYVPKKVWNRTEFKDDEKLEYLKYGLSKIPEEINLKELTSILNEILGKNRFTEARKRYYEKITVDSEKEDDFDKEYNYLKSKL